MKPSEAKQAVGYSDLDVAESCGTCGNCAERGHHLRCGRHGFAVTALGICRNGYRKGPRQIEMNFPKENPQ